MQKLRKNAVCPIEDTTYFLLCYKLRVIVIKINAVFPIKKFKKR